LIDFRNGLRALESRFLSGIEVEFQRMGKREIVMEDKTNNLEKGDSP
jgi:hypothetical protein